MAAKKIIIEGTAEFGGNAFICVCAKCGHNERENATIEFNFREQKVFYLCSACKKMNEMFFGQQPTPSLPRIGMGR